MFTEQQIRETRKRRAAVLIPSMFCHGRCMPLSLIEKSLLLAAYFRGGNQADDVWTSNSDQILTLSLFYTGDINVC